MSDAAYPPLERFNKEENYSEFERVRGFDIRGELIAVRSEVPDTRDARDPEKIGNALLSRPSGISITDYADMIEEVK